MGYNARYRKANSPIGVKDDPNKLTVAKNARLIVIRRFFMTGGNKVNWVLGEKLFKNFCFIDDYLIREPKSFIAFQGFHSFHKRFQDLQALKGFHYL